MGADQLMGLGARDPIRNALRDLVRAKVLVGWQGTTMHPEGETRWTVTPADGVSGTYTTEQVNALIAMYWEAAA